MSIAQATALFVCPVAIESEMFSSWPAPSDTTFESEPCPPLDQPSVRLCVNDIALPHRILLGHFAAMRRALAVATRPNEIASLDKLFPDRVHLQLDPSQLVAGHVEDPQQRRKRRDRRDDGNGQFPSHVGLVSGE